MAKEMKRGKRGEYITSEIKLCSLLLSEVPESEFEILPNGHSAKKLVKIIYPSDVQADVNRLITEFIERRARVQVFHYNQNLNRLRDAIKSAL